MAARRAAGADDDRPRLLASRSELGYTSSAFDSVHEEPEAISAQEQREMTAAVHRAEAERLRRKWQETENRVGQELDHFVHDSGVRVSKRLDSGIRAVRRAARAVGRRVEEEADVEERSA